MFLENIMFIIGLEVMRLDAKIFGCFVADRRKELKMTQKELAAKIQVTDKAVSKWERGLGFLDIKIEGLANALDVSILELMKSEKNTDIVSVSETERAVSNVLNIAEQEVESRHRVLTVIYAVTVFICSIVEMLFSIDWSGQSLTMTARIPYCAIVPGIVLVLYSVICKVRGQKVDSFLAIGICLIFVPIILVLAIFLILGVVAG